MKVSLKDDRMPEGTELHVRNLGMLVNGNSVEFSDERIAEFEEARGLSLEEAFANDERISVGKASKLPAVKEEPAANLDEPDFETVEPDTEEGGES